MEEMIHVASRYTAALTRGQTSLLYGVLFVGACIGCSRRNAVPARQRSCGNSAEEGCGLVAISGATITMGDTRPGPSPYTIIPINASPLQPHVTVSAFYIDRFEVSVSRFRQFWLAGHPAPAGPIRYPGSHEIVWEGTVSSPTRSDGRNKCTWTADVGPFEQMPVTCIDWSTAMAFCVWDGGRLPTEAEWERASRGPNDPGRMYPWGEQTLTPDRVNLCDDGCQRSRGVFSGDQSQSFFNDFATALGPVDSHPTGVTPEGVFNLSGNAFEWLADWYAPYSDRSCWGGVPQENPLCGKRSYLGHAFRGCAWNGHGGLAWFRPASRNGTPGTVRHYGLGFRCAVSGDQ